MRQDLVALTPSDGFKEMLDYRGNGTDIANSLFNLYVNYTRLCLQYPEDEQALDIDTELYYLSLLVNVFKSNTPNESFEEFLTMVHEKDVATCFLSLYINITRLLIKYPDDNHSDNTDLELYILGQLIHLFNGTYMVGKQRFAA